MNRWPQDNAYSWEKFPFLRILIPFIAAIVVYNIAPLPTLSISYLITSIIVSLLVYTGIYMAKRHNALYTLVSFVAFTFSFFSAGIAISFVNDIRNDDHWFGRNIDTKGRYLVRITGEPAEKNTSWKLPVEAISVVSEGKVQSARGKAFIYVNRSLAPVPYSKGDTILTPGKWQPITNAGNPYEYDYATHCAQNNIYYRQICMPWDLKLYGAASESAQPLTDKVHTSCMALLDNYLTDKKTKGLIQAMLLGDEVNLDENQRQAYSETGIIHIVAISGSHVMGFVALLSLLLFFIRHKKYQWVKLAIALPLVWFYVLMAGAPPSAVRAAVMFSLLAISVFLQKNNSNINTLFASAFILLCADPNWLFSVGFQLSFVAVLSLLIFYKPIRSLLSPQYKVIGWLWDAAALSIAAEILVAPLVIYYFHTFPLLFIVANVVAGVFMGVVMLLSLGIIAFAALPVVAKLIASGTVFLVTIFDKLIYGMQHFNPTSFLFLQVSGLELILVYTAIAAFTLSFIKKRRQPLLAGLGLSCVFVASLCYDDWQTLQQRRLVVYNSGQPSHAELITGNHFSILHSDTTSTKRASYATGAAHKGLQSWLRDDNASELVYIQNKKVLVLKDYMQAGNHFPVDYLIITLPGISNIPKLHEIFSPSTIILANRISHTQLDRLREECAQRHIMLHVPAKDGAFVIE
jgi:competence protein ComEC